MTQLTNEAIRYIEDTDTGLHYYEMTPQEARASRTVPKWQSALAPTLASIEDKKITVRDDSKINVRIYTPVNEKMLPIIVYYHGGGWVFGDLESADAGCQLLADKAQAIVVSIDYRLAPEFPFPTPVFDAYDALLWVHEHAAELNGDPSRLIVAGDSAGGNLATVMTHIAKQENGPAITAQALIYPVTNTNFTMDSYKKFGAHFGLDIQGMEWFSGHYSISENLANPLVSPLQAKDFTDLPKTILLAGEADVLFDEGVSYAEKLATAGVEVKHIVMPGLIHSYFSKMEYFEKATIETVEKIAAFINCPSS
ncbi:esterase [Lysinibacillus contaminans]|uniref:Esterase n=1 Tax=Lysinibacillus contaminans TaxID=1293441 RepID=A0ABR5K108_9BACI|nr:alpha/beta hydrolase [Lysinibacillus contaminans]KOS68425.1 esterase [Lysinibacillus contaminans]